MYQITVFQPNTFVSRCMFGCAGCFFFHFSLIRLTLLFCFNFQWVSNGVRVFVCRATRHTIYNSYNILHTSKLLIFIVHYLAGSAKHFLKCMSFVEVLYIFLYAVFVCVRVFFSSFVARLFLSRSLVCACVYFNSFHFPFYFSIFSLLTLNQNYLTFSRLCLPSPRSFSIHLIFICA